MVENASATPKLVVIADVESYRREIDLHILYLAEAVAATSPALFRYYTEWATAVSLSNNVPTERLRESYLTIAAVLRDSESTADAAVAIEYLQDAVGLIGKGDAPAPSPMAGAHEVAPRVLDWLLDCRRQEAIDLVDATVAEGTSVLDVYLQVFQPVLREVGRLWQYNRISVAQEHYCSAAIQLMMGRFSDRIFASERIGKTIVSACVGDELHEIGLRMVADAMEASGWDTHFLGANVPAADLVKLARRVRADVVALSVTLTSNLSRLNDIIGALRDETALEETKLVVGGYPFIVQPDLWRKVGADGCAGDAAQAIEVCTELVER